MSWEDILKKELTVMAAIIEIQGVLSEYKNVETESTRQLIGGYRYQEIENIYDNFFYDDDEAPKPNTHTYYIQCNVGNYTGVLFATHLDDDTKEIDKFLKTVMKLSFNDKLEDAKDFLTPLNDDWMEE